MGIVTETKFCIVVQILKNREFLNQKIILGNMTNQAFYPFFFPVNINTIDEYIAGCRLSRTIQYIQKSRFTGTAGTHDTDKSSRFFCKAHVIKPYFVILELKTDIMYIEYDF